MANFAHTLLFLALVETVSETLGLIFALPVSFLSNHGSGKGAAEDD